MLAVRDTLGGNIRDATRSILDGGWRWNAADNLWQHFPTLQGRAPDLGPRYFGADGAWHDNPADAFLVRADGAFAMDGTVADALPPTLRDAARAVIEERANTPAWMAEPDGRPTLLPERDWLRRESERYSVTRDAAPTPAELAEAARQYDAIVARYTNPDGTRKPGWMKAPNGAPTKLTERQWVQVRTPNFKRWFGDWEARYYSQGWQDKIDPAAIRALPALDISGYAPLADKAAIAEAFETFGEVTNANDGRKVRFPANVAGRMVYKRNYIGAFKKLFETSVKAWSENETQFEGHKAHPNIRAYHQYVNKFTDAAAEHYVRFTVREDNPGKGAQNNIHGAEVTAVEVYEKGNDSTLPEFQTGRSESPNGARTSRQDRKLALFLSDFNPSSVSKVVDENGEPRVMWRGAPFDPLSQAPGKGVIAAERYFTPSEAYARRYEKGAGATRAYFLNVRSPFDVRNERDAARMLELRGGHDFHVGSTGALDWAEAPTAEEIDELWPGEYDGLVLDEGGDPAESGPAYRGESVVPFAGGAQVKSATDNTGVFSASPDVRYSVTPAERAPAAAPGGAGGEVPRSSLPAVRGTRPLDFLRNADTITAQQGNPNVQRAQPEPEPDDEFRRLQVEARGMPGEVVRAYHSGVQICDEGILARLRDVLSRRVGAARRRNGYGVQLLTNGKTGADLRIGRVDGATFHDVFEIARQYLKYGDLVDLHDSYGDDVQCWLSDDGLSGFAVEPDGNIVSVFSLGGGGFLRTVFPLIRKVGGRKLDCYALDQERNLPSLYEKHFGFKRASSMAYDESFEPEDPARERHGFGERHGMPRIVFMVADPGHAVEEKTFDGDYDGAVAWQNANLPTRSRYSISHLYTGSAADYAERVPVLDKDGNVTGYRIDNAPSLQYVGRGEGSQVYGWGLYASDQRGVAEGYSKARGNNSPLLVDGKSHYDLAVPIEEARILSRLDNVVGWNVDDGMSQDDAIRDALRASFWTDEERAVLRKYEGRLSYAHRNLYEQTFFTDRAPGDESHLLKWYKPVSKEHMRWVVDEARAEGVYDRLAYVFNLKKQWGGDFYENIAKHLGPRGTSEFLARAGIDGIKYPVDSWGGKTVKNGDEAGWNYVSFRDDNIRVDHKWTDGVQRYSITVNRDLSSDIAAALSKRTKDNPNAVQKGRHEDILLSENIPFFEFLGLPNRPVKTEVVKIRKLVIRHHLSEAQIAELPQRYNAPVAVAVDSAGGIVVLTDMKAMSDDGAEKPVMIYFRPRRTKNGDIVFLASAYARGSEDEQDYYGGEFKSGCLFVDENKLAGLGLEEGTESTLRTLAADERVLTASDYSWWTTRRTFAQSPGSVKTGARHSVVPRLWAFDPGRLPSSIRWGTLNGHDGNIVGLVAMSRLAGRRMDSESISQLARRLGVKMSAPEIRQKADDLLKGDMADLAARLAGGGDVAGAVAALSAAAEPRTSDHALIRQAFAAGAKRGQAAEKMRSRVASAVLEAQRGADLAEITREFGFDVAAILHSWTNEVEKREGPDKDIAPLPDPLSALSALEDPDGTKAEDAAARLAQTRAEIAERFQQLFAETRRLAKAREELANAREEKEETQAPAAGSGSPPRSVP